ncbi:acyl-CoA dehydrogenase family protein [Schinkia azotoformans]|uniref:Dibenzothiophene monooxygenase n=1 Tax=Schinkia azotoformans LMG 9581 TaxID=1131731 RepID=K6D7H1_SCHAZ|nr:acyl-CoA dehydrogenase family protein [Schinkia azotoformans]EKN64008.1 acyl-CoA dehydrogenase type 2 [Schinkia azotoformans LMG 9581]MEC1640558.1 acyl-CoA dehydrogenase family protein [Schinkia azotoformans]MEC1944557.1 acyl-CoA dehydrogenase family protein [Schinkia azotoformans]
MAIQTVSGKSSKEIAENLAIIFYENAADRDLKGGNPKLERDLIRESGLLKVLIPKQFGGWGESWTDVVQIVRLFAKYDSSLAHVYGYHFVNLITAHLWGNKEQQEFYFSETAEKNLFWGNAFNPIDMKLYARKEKGNFVLNGVKTFCTGSVDSDYLIVSALYENQDHQQFIAIIPTNRQGITVNEDWDNFGQRQTDSGTITFTNVMVKKEEVLQNGLDSSEFAKLRLNISHFILNHVFLGIMEGALEAAKKYTKTKKRIRTPNNDSVTGDPIIQRHYGEFYVQLEASKLLVEKTDTLFERLWNKGEAITEEERLELNQAVYTAKAFTTNAGLELTSRMFEVMGSRATANQYRFDRYWRNMRTMTLHYSIDNVIQQLGEWVLHK